MTPTLIPVVMKFCIISRSGSQLSWESRLKEDWGGERKDQLKKRNLAMKRKKKPRTNLKAKFSKEEEKEMERINQKTVD